VKQNRMEFLIQLFVEPYRFFVQSISFQNKNVILLFSLFSWKRNTTNGWNCQCGVNVW
jgi:hypothetical protein